MRWSNLSCSVIFNQAILLNIIIKLKIIRIIYVLKEASQPSQLNPLRLIIFILTSMIHLKIHFKTEYGQAVYIAGNSKYLGQWNIKQAIRMTWKEGDIWEAEVAYHEMEYKYFVADYDSVQNTYWEYGPNRVTNKHTTDIWNHRNVYFQCVNPHQNEVYISGSSQNMGQFLRRIRMKNKNGISYHKTLLDITDKNYYQYHVVTKNEFTSQVFELDLSSEQSYYKNALLITCNGLMKLKQIVFQLDNHICYGFVPNTKEDYSLLKKANIKSVIEFCNTQDKSLGEQYQTEGLLHMVVNLYHFKQENFTQRLFNLISVLIQKYKTLYICNNSLLHLRKYLHLYEKLSKCHSN